MPLLPNETSICEIHAHKMYFDTSKHCRDTNHDKKCCLQSNDHSKLCNVTLVHDYGVV